MFESSTPTTKGGASSGAPPQGTGKEFEMKAMLLTKDKNGRVVPEDDGDLPMFSHCCNGMIAVNTKYFYENKFIKIIEAHGFDVTYMPETDGGTA